MAINQRHPRVWLNGLNYFGGQQKYFLDQSCGFLARYVLASRRFYSIGHGSALWWSCLSNERLFNWDFFLNLQLTSTKDAENKTTLLHYLVDIIEEKFPDILIFNEEILHVDRASRVSMDTIQKTLKQMDSSIKNLEMDLKNNVKAASTDDDRFLDVMGNFANEARDQCDVLQRMGKKMETVYQELAEYFVFDPQKYTLDEFFTDVKTFKDSFQVSFLFLFLFGRWCLDVCLFFIQQCHKDNCKLRETEEKIRRAREAKEKAEREKLERQAKKKALVDMNADDDQEGVMDSLLEALKTGSAFSRDQRRKRDRPPRAVGGKNNRVNLQCY